MTITLNGTTGITTPAQTVQGDLTTTGNTVLGDASTDTLNVANGSLIKDSSGNLGVNVTPSAWTDFKGIQIGQRFSAVSEGTVADLYLNSYYASGSYRYIANGYATQYRQQDGNHIFYNAASGTAGNSFSYTERMRIDSSGNLLVGSTTTQNNNRLYVQSNNFMVGINGTNSSGEMVRFYSNGSTAGTISYTATTVAYNTSSDYRLKENIAPMTGALAKVSALKPVTYTWKVDGSSGQGFIAHELQAVVPDCVTGEKDAVDADGKPVYQGIDTSFLVATLTAAIQELKAELDTVKTELATLKGTA